MSVENYNRVRDQSMSLAPEEQLALISDLITSLGAKPPSGEQKPGRSMQGALAHLGPGPSAEEIDEVRREVWANVPRDDF